MTKIMIIDDQPLLAKWLTNDLEDEGYHISWMVNTDNIKEDIRTFMPDIILFDIYLNGFERWDILERIKWERPHLPVLIVSFFDTFISDPHCAKADGYIIKDIYMDKLRNKMVELLNSNID